MNIFFRKNVHTSKDLLKISTRRLIKLPNSTLMKKYPYSPFMLIMLVLSMSLIPMACGSDDSDPVVVTEDPKPDPTNASTTIEATSPVVADGTATSAVTVTLADTKGNRFNTSGGTVALVSTGAASISAVTDNSNGTYAATVTNTTAETITISGTLGGIAITDTAEITFDPVPEPEPDPTGSTIEATSPVVADGMASSTVTVTLIDTEGDPFTTSGGTVTLVSTGVSSISEVTDNSDGTYAATVTNTAAGIVTISGTLGGTTITDTAEITFNPVLDPDGNAEESTEPVGPTLIKINCGGGEVTINDETFLEDQYFEGASFTFVNELLTEVEDTELDELFYTERVTSIGEPTAPLFYKIPVSNGTYTVKLYWAEVYWGVHPDGIPGGVGSRIFSVEMEGLPIVTDIDLFEELGTARADTRMYDIEVNDGELTIMFQSTVDRPKISGIEIFGTGAVND